ncbi:MAG: apolipoprotein N-acyltransferase [Acidobacteria bacterium]|nr:apolipoprotein N-acyltransferase [Acidobacteriota bacterium]
MAVFDSLRSFLKRPPPAQSVHGRTHELRRGLCLAAFSGALWALVCVNFSAWPLAFVAMVPGLFAIERATSTRRAVLFGWSLGLVGNACGFYWMFGTMRRFAGLPWWAAALLFLSICGFQALRMAFFGWALRLIRNHSGLPLALVAPVVLVTVELCIPLIFPFYLAMSVAQQPLLIQIADLTGVAGVSALLLMVNGAIYDLLSGAQRRRDIAAVSFAILLAAVCYGFLRVRQFTRQRALAPKIKVGIVQPNAITYALGGGNQVFAERRIADLQARSAELEAAGADLIVWPESSYPRRISRQANGDRPDSDPLRIKRGFNTPLVFNVTTYQPPLSSGQPYNSAILLDMDGKFRARYDKNNLFMFGEYTPGLATFPWLENFSPLRLEQFAAGGEINTLPFQTGDGREWRLGPMICLEDILPGFGRRLGALHPHLLVNLTNDSWFGETTEPWQHLALSVFRSVELRTELVRAANTGVSTYVDATGRVYAATYVVDPARDTRGADKVLAEVALIEGGHTLYALAGDYFSYLCIALTLYLSLVAPWLRRRE